MAGDLTTIARPYAEAAYGRAKELGQVQDWSDALGLLSGITDDPDMARQIANPNVPRARVRDILLEIAADAVPGEVANLVRLLADNARLAAIPEISALFEVSREADQGVSQVMVRSAFPLDDAQQKQISEAMARRLGGQVDLAVQEDAALLGGIEIRAGDLVIDDSVRGKLDQLSHALQF